MKYFLFLLFVVAVGVGPTWGADGVLATAESSDGRVRARLACKPLKPTIADTIILTLTIDAERTVDVVAPSFGTSFGELAILDTKEELIGVDTNHETKKIVLRTTPKKAGSLPIWPIPINYTDRRDGSPNESQTIVVPPSRIEVSSSITPETASLDNIDSTYRLIDLRNKFSRWTIIGIVALVLAALALFFLLRRRRTVVESLPTLSPKEIALKRLDNLLESRLHESDVKKFFFELTGIVRWYVEQTSNIRAPELTTEEFLRTVSVRHGDSTLFSDELRNRLRLFLESADMVKFAKFKPNRDEIMLCCQRAREFF